jgi:ATP-binding cassette subfamily F protein uup
VDTLELLEDLLADYDGTLLLVSHDRTFLDNVVTNTLVFEGTGRVKEYVGGYEDWLRQRQPHVAQRIEAPTRSGTPAPVPAPDKRSGKSRRLSYKEQRELEALPGKIESLETEQSQLHATIGDAGFYQQPGDIIAATMERLEAVTRELEVCYTRWQALESQATANE